MQVLDEEDDEEVKEAMKAAGRTEAQTTIPAHLARDWGVAMNLEGSGNMNGTASSIAKRLGTLNPFDLAAKLGIPQVHLSLDLPEPWTSSMPRASEDVRALQLLELGLRRVCEQALREHQA